VSVKTDRAFEELYEKEAHSVFAAVYLLCHDAPLAEDATQEAFARALERWERLRAMPWAAGWVTTTAMNFARRALRHRPFLLAASPDPPFDEDVIELWDRVRRLPRRQQEVVVLHYRLGLPVNEVAHVLGCRERTVRTHLARGRDALRLMLQGATNGA
jgi:RNA polymerase sigma-70 factor (ECF subfamily)